MTTTRSSSAALRVAHVTSIHQDFNSRIWKYTTALADAGCEVHLVCPWIVPEGVGPSGIHFHPFRRVTSRLQRPLLIPHRLLSRLLPLLERVDLVHFHDIDILPWMALLSRRKPVIYDIHENYPEEMLVRDWIPRLARVPLYHGVDWIERFLARRIRNVVLVVPAQKPRFNGEHLRRIFMPNYAAQTGYSGNINDNYCTRSDCVIFTGSNYEDNGSLLLLEVAARLKILRPQLRFLVRDFFASMSFRRTFLEMRRARGLEEHVVLFEEVPAPKVPSLLNQATIGISPNLRVRKQEMALPQKIFEYMAAALPIVCSDLPYVKAMLAEQEVGFLAQPEDPGSFVRAIVKLVDDRSFAREMGIKGRENFVRRYSWDSQVPPLLDYYHKIVNGFSLRCLHSERN